MASLDLTMLSPLPVYLDESGPQNRLAPRPATLDGRIVGLLPNWRPSAVEILRAIGTLLGERYRLRDLVVEQPVRELPIRTGKLSGSPSPEPRTDSTGSAPNPGGAGRTGLVAPAS